MNLGTLSPAFLLISLIPLTAAEVTLDPTLHLRAVAGHTSAETVEDLALHGHDPNNDFTLQEFDLALNLRVDDWFEAFANGIAFTDADGELDAEWEEAFVKIMEIPGGFELRGGRYLNRFGIQNNVHLHGWDFVNSNLSTATFLGEEGLRTDGAELTWTGRFDKGFFSLSGSYGRAVSDDHGHGEEEEHEDEEEDEEHHDEEEEEAVFEDDVFTVRAMLGYNHNDFNQHQFGLNFGRDTNSELYAADYQYTWRENGLEEGGRALTAGVEYFQLNDQEHSETRDGWMVFASYRFTDPLALHFRYEDLENRRRFSTSLTRSFEIANQTDLHLRLQYQHDDFDDHDEDTVFLQFGLDFGDGEVR